MGKGRPARRSAVPTPTDDRAYVHAIEREFGAAWASHAGHARVWSFLLIEIPQQLLAHKSARIRALRAQLETLEDFFPDDPKIAVLRAQLEPGAHIRCGLTPGAVDTCTIATLVKTVGRWPDSRDARVEFSLCRSGELRIRCVDTTADRAKLPPYARAPRSSQDAREVAASLVRAALSLIDETNG